MTDTTLSNPGSSFAVVGYRALWFTGLMWHVARWMAVFTTTFRVNEQTGDPLLVQLVGTTFMAPMFLGGALAGTISDRFEPTRTVRLALGVLIPLSGMMALAVSADRAPVAVSYLFIFCIGVGNVIDMTARRTIAFGLVGAGLVTNAAALETLALHSGNMIGSFLGGAVIQASGTALVYLGVGMVYVVASWSFLGSVRTCRSELRPLEPPVVQSTDSSTSADLLAAFGLLSSNGVLRQFLVTTVIMNFFYYAFMPLIPVFAEELGVGALATGLLASAVGAGTMTGAFVISRLQPSRRGLLHVVGSCGAMCMLLVFANLSWFPLALLVLFVGGLCGAGFGTTQAALVISLVDEELRGRALGVMSMAIGSLPFGMLSLGLLARRTDPQMAVTASVSVGLLLLIGWHLSRPHLRKL